MLIRIFRTDSAIQFISLLLTGFLLWLPGFLHPVADTHAWSPVPVFEKLTAFFNTIPWLLTMVAFILLLVEGIFLTLILSSHDLAPRNSALPAIIYTIFMSWHPSVLTLYPALLSNAFLIFFLYMFLKVYERPDAFKEVFSACFTLGAVSLLDLPLSVFLVLVWFGFLIYRVFSWREWIISLIGFFLPLVYASLYYFWSDHGSWMLSRVRSFLQDLHWISFRIDLLSMIVVILMGIFCLGAILKVISLLQEKVISLRKKFLFLIWFFFLSLPVFLFSGHDPWTQGSICLLPASILISYHLSLIKRFFWWETVFTAFLIGLLGLRLV